MTGFYVRVKTDAGDWENKDIAALSDTEIERFVSASEQRDINGWDWVRALAKWIRDNVKTMPTEPT